MGGRRQFLLTAVVLICFGACTGERPHLTDTTVESTTTTSAATSTSTTSALAQDTTWVAQAQPAEVAVYDDPGAPAPSQTIPNPNENGVPLVFLVNGPQPDGGWVHVHLPMRPSGSVGWVRAADVRIVSNTYRVTVELTAHQLTVTNAGTVELQAPVGVGTTDTPTPGGVYYIKELLQPPDPTGPYGTYAYGLSGFSNVLTKFAGGEGVIGIHGTNDPSSIGSDVSHGGIRVANEVIDQMAGILPLGTPVEILP